MNQEEAKKEAGSCLLCESMDKGKCTTEECQLRISGREARVFFGAVERRSVRRPKQ